MSGLLTPKPIEGLLPNESSLLGPMFGNPLMARKVAAQRAAYPRQRLDTVGDAFGLASGMFSFAPGIGDAFGLAADAHRYATEPESRTWGNYGLTLAGLLPGIPSMSAVVHRGGRVPKDGYFYSRDPDYAKGFDKGDFRQYSVNADSALNFGSAYNAAQLEPVIKSLRESGDAKAAQQIADALKEGPVLGGHLYLWLKNLSKDSPEAVFKKAGFDALDFGRDIRVLNPAAVSY